ncbi:uncharacterized protein LOC121862920 isoform X3 [Homarus americanus]|uniref:uncharacterized protein LOC121862920 isoform X3 n=1 Tax=Homarus americanus TaxID=6706 RepID=UPI001C443D6F|nr:uncharacterized protein LOC121862920 isoform X3 [Homarus americanus]
MGSGNVVAVCVLVAGSVYHALAYPIAPEGLGREGGWNNRDYIHAVLGVAALLSSVTTLLACVCCKRSRGFKRSDSGLQELGSVSSRVEGSTNTINHGPREEFTMFPPAGISQLSLSTTQINFEPLPDIRLRPGTHDRDQRITDKTLPASFPGQGATTPGGLPTDEWFAEPHQNFPRNQLQYVKEIGKGWFGQVLEGRATGIFSDHTKGDSPTTSSLTPNTSPRGQTPVAVKVLREDATPTEQMYFLQELRPYRDLSHPNVLKVLAHCLETEPFLILMQLCPKGDLKDVVKHDKGLTESTILRMIVDVSAGLMHMHSHAFIHTDLAARNCVVDEDNSVKIGDYGYNIDFYKNEYYCAGEVALPLRWCAPETLKCTDTTIETKEVTKAANVWSFGIIMWEIASRGELPYKSLDDDQVIQQVVVDQTCLLESPKTLELHSEKIYNIMKLCWDPEYSRAPMTHIHSLLMHLWENSSLTCQDTSTMNDFERRWDQLQQQHCRDHSIMHAANTSDLRFESDFNLSVQGKHHLGGAMSPSLQNLHGSVEDLDAKIADKFGSALPSWLGMEPGQPIDSLTREITDAILKLDDYLAGEKSEPSTAQVSPEKGGINFKFGKDSFVSNPPEAKIARVGRLFAGEGSGHPSLTRTLSDGEDEGFTMRLEQGEFTEMVRLKSQSVQDFMKLTVVDDGSDSDNASQKNSLAFESLTQEKNFSSEGNIREALRDVKFMSELERLQAEHKYSIITEASRENASSIEYRLQDFNLDQPLHESDTPVLSEAGSTDKLATSTESDNSNNFHERYNSERDPFLGEVISSDLREEKKMNVCNTKEEDGNSTDSGENSVGSKPMLASPDCVVSSREPKPVALPDIVVHDSGVKLSTPSPPPVESPVKIINSNQPKEFRFIFEDQSVSPSTCGSKFTFNDGHDTHSQTDSVVFSENIRNTDVNRSDECRNNNNEGIGYRRINNFDELDSPLVKQSLEKGHEDVNKMGELNKFLTYMQENGKERLTSTPCKKDIIENATKTDETTSEGKYKSVSLNNESGVPITDLVGDKEMPVNGINLKARDSDTKQRLVFVSTSSRTEDDDNSVEEEEEDMALREEHQEEVPSYKPEKIIKGEDIVIGALDDYSLDLYRAVKSTEIPAAVNEAPAKASLPAEGNKEAYLYELPKESVINKSKGNENEAIGIEVDLEQWDKFLGSTMNGEKDGSETVFRESFDENVTAEGKVASDVLDSSFVMGESDPDNKVPMNDLDMNHSNFNFKDKPDLSTTFEHSTCDEICEIMANDKDTESDTTENRPQVNVKMFFGSDSSITDVDTTCSDVPDSVMKTPGILKMNSLINNSSSQQSKSSDESYITAESRSLTQELQTSGELSELYKTTLSKYDTEATMSVSETISLNSTGNTPLKVNSTEASQSSLVDSYIIDNTPSNSFTYKREASVDGTIDDISQKSASEILKPCTGISEDVLHKTIPKSENRIPSTSETVSSGAFVNNSSLGSNAKNEDLTSEASPTAVDSGISLTSHILSLENIHSSFPVALSTEKDDGLDVRKHEVIIVKEDDDLSPSAYQTKLKYDDCWNSQESQDSAVGNDEAENGDFWQQQMMAWQEAAFQTRQLLQQAAGGSGTSLAGHKGSQENLLEASPRSDSSSTKSPYSSNDMLSLDDEGTYVSYNTTDDEEVLGYKPEDINALRAELNLKLGGLQEDKEQLEPEEPDDTSSSDRESVTINYRGIMTTTLSPIKEESYLEDDDSPLRKANIKDSCNLDSILDQSIEFEEPSSVRDDTFILNEAVNEQIVSKEEPGLITFSLEDDEQDKRLANEHSTEESKSTNGLNIADEAQTDTSVKNTVETVNECLSFENAHDSLILEDLDEDNGPSSIHIYNSGNSFDGEDMLIVDTVTNEAKIVDRGKPRSHLAFINDQEEQPETKEILLIGYEESDDVAPESIPSVGGSRFDEMRHREEFLRNNPSWEKPGNIKLEDYEGDSESRPEVEFVVSDLPPDSPQGIQVPHYHSYFTSALSTISHPNASIEEPPIFEQVEHISLPYDVNYPSAGEHLHSLEDFGEQDGSLENQVSGGTKEEAKISEIEDDDDAPIKLNFLGRLYSDESVEKDEEKSLKSCESREATLLSDSDEEEGNDEQQVARPKTPEPNDINQMTSSEFLASQSYQITDHEEVEEQIEAEREYEDDSEDDEYSPSQSPRKMDRVELQATQDPRYTPDWESDTDSDEDSSSTSGEFMWRQEEEEKEKSKEDVEKQEEPGEQCQQSSYVLDVIEEEPEDDMEEEEGEFSEDSESGEEEFTPSKWNSDLTPSHSLLKSPQNRSSLKKKVRWKRQRHHRVYEYPPEPRSWEPTPTEPHQRRSWGRSSLDYLSLAETSSRQADWDLGADEFIADDGGDMEDYVYRKPSRPAPPPPIYTLGSVAYDDAPEGFLVDNGEFFIRSSGSPFTFTSSSFSASDFFPGSHSASDYDVIFGGPAQTPGFSDALTSNSVDHIGSESDVMQEDEQRLNRSGAEGHTLTADIGLINPSYPITEESEQLSSSGTGLGQLRHTRDKLRLEIPTISLAGDAAKSTTVTLENGESGLEKYNGQSFSSINLKRTEPEVSEV